MVGSQAPQLLAMSQMCFGMFYSLVIISQTVSRMGEPLRNHIPVEERNWLQRCLKHDTVRTVRVTLRKHILLCTVVMQSINYLILYCSDKDSFAVRTKVSAPRP